MTKNIKYTYCFSLGCNCAVAMGLVRMGLRCKSGPFDWIVSDFASVMDCINNGFEDYISKDCCVVDENMRRKFVNQKYQFVFPHDVKNNFTEEFEEIKMKYDRRIKIFYEMIQEPTIFLRFVKDNDEIKWINKHKNEVDKVLMNFNKNNRIIYLLLSRMDSLDDGIECIRLKRDKHSGDVKELNNYLIESPEVVSFCNGLLDDSVIEKNKLFMEKMKNCR